MAVAVTSRGRLLEVLVSPSGSWSLVLTAPGGRSCLVAAGSDWQALTPPPPDT